MQTRRLFVQFIPYAILVGFLAVISVAVRNLFNANPHLADETEVQVFALGSVFFLGYIINKLSPKTAIPSFVWAIFAGLALQPLLSAWTHDVSILKIVMEVFGAIVLFAGGLEIPFSNFKRWFFPIVSLSLVGLVISAIMFAFVMAGIMRLFFEWDASLLPTIVILAAALASTDPTAIIPTLEALKFKRPFLKQIAISESALTDVSGSIVTRFLLVALVAAPATGGVLSFFSPLFRKASYDALALQIISGVVVGWFGFWLIKKFYGAAAKSKEHDPALLISVPIFTFALGNVLGGAGFLAAFLAGLFSDVQGGLKPVSHFYDSLLNHLIKPFIFIILGALVPIGTLVALAPVGIISALLFMFVIRPIVVFISLLPWTIRRTFKFRDLIFLSFIRETGIIAAVLIVIASSNGLLKSDYLVAVGMWVILFTLVVEPPLTPWLARKVGVAE